MTLQRLCLLLRKQRLLGCTYLILREKIFPLGVLALLQGAYSLSGSGAGHQKCFEADLILECDVGDAILFEESVCEAFNLM